MFDVDGIKTLLHSRLSKKRYNHSLNVAAEARKLAFRYGVDPDRAYAAGLLHDICTVSYTHLTLPTILRV